MSTLTENYGFIKPEKTDYYDVEHFNHNMDIIDKELKEHTHQNEDVKEESSKILIDTGVIGEFTAGQDLKLTDDAISFLCFGNGKFMAFSTNRKTFTSEDGLAWTAGTDVADAGVVKFATFANDRFFCGLDNKKLYYSTDGVVWTASNFEYGDGITAIAYGNSKYVLGYSRYIFTSDDAVTWTVAYSGEKKISAILYAQGKFVASDNITYILRSEDGVAWTKSSSSVDKSYNEYTTVYLAYGKGKFVLHYNGKGYYSDDAVTWTASTNKLLSYWNLHFGSDAFFTSGKSYAGVYWSRDGIKWEKLNDESYKLEKFAYGNGKIVTMVDTVMYVADDSKKESEVVEAIDYLLERSRIFCEPVLLGKYSYVSPDYTTVAVDVNEIKKYKSFQLVLTSGTNNSQLDDEITLHNPVMFDETYAFNTKVHLRSRLHDDLYADFNFADCSFSLNAGDCGVCSINIYGLK